MRVIVNAIFRIDRISRFFLINGGIRTNNQNQPNPLNQRRIQRILQNQNQQLELADSFESTVESKDSAESESA